MLTSRVAIRATPARVWRVVGDPGMLPRWNGNFRSVAAHTPGAPSAGSRYVVTVRFGGRESVADLEIDEYEPLHRMVTVMRGGRLPAGRFVRETIEIDGDRDPQIVYLTQRVDLRHSGIPLLWRALMTLIHRVGRPVGTPHLRVLGLLVEQGIELHDSEGTQ